MSFLLGILIGVIISSTFFLLFKRKNDSSSESKYQRRGIYIATYHISNGYGLEKGDVEVTYEIGELESTDDLSKVEVIRITSNLSEYNSEYYKKKLKDMIDKTWIDSSIIKWIINSKSDIRNNKIDKILTK